MTDHNSALHHQERDRPGVVSCSSGSGGIHSKFPFGCMDHRNNYTPACFSLDYILSFQTSSLNNRDRVIIINRESFKNNRIMLYGSAVSMEF